MSNGQRAGFLFPFFFLFLTSMMMPIVILERVDCLTIARGKLGFGSEGRLHLVLFSGLLILFLLFSGFRLM